MSVFFCFWMGHSDTEKFFDQAISLPGEVEKFRFVFHFYVFRVFYGVK